MKKLFFFFAFALFANRIVKSQNIGISSTGATPDASAMLDIVATDKGLLVPRVALTATNSASPVASPTTSLLVYNTATAGTAPNNVLPGYYYWGGSSWIALVTTITPTTNWSLTGNSGTTAGTNFIGTTDSKDFIFKTSNTERMRITSNGRVGVGVTSPGFPFSVKDTIEIKRVGTVSQLLFSNTSGLGDFRISGDGGDLFWQGGGSRALQMGSYWTTILSGDRQTSAPPAFITGTNNNRGVLITSSRDVSVPLSIKGFSATQSGNLTEWLNSAGTAVSVIDTKGNMGIGTSVFDATNQEKLVVDAGVTTSVNAIYAKGNINSYFQNNISNLSNGNQASSDIVATANNGTEITNFVDLGINGGSYVYQSGNPILTGKANDGYLLSAGNDFYLVNNNTSKDMLFLTGGTATTNERMRILSTGNVGIGTSAPISTLSINGSLSYSGRVINSSYTLLATDNVLINIGAAVTWTLPAANTAGGRTYRLVNQGSGNVTLSQAVTIANGVTTTTIGNAAGSNSFEIISDGTVWRKIN